MCIQLYIQYLELTVSYVIKINTSRYEARHSGFWLYLIQNVVGLKEKKTPPNIVSENAEERFLNV